MEICFKCRLPIDIEPDGGCVELTTYAPPNPALVLYYHLRCPTYAGRVIRAAETATM